MGGGGRWIFTFLTRFGHFVRLGGKVGDLVTYKCLKFKVTEITLDQACAQCLEYKDFNEHFTAEESLNKFIMQRSHEEMLNE